MLGAVVGISLSQLLPSLDSQQRQGGPWQDGWARSLVKDFSLLKALKEEGGRKLSVKPISVGQAAALDMQASVPCEGGQLTPQPCSWQPPSKRRGFHDAGLDQDLSVSCCCPACHLLRGATECSSWVK